MTKSVHTFLMFTGRAEEAMTFYQALFACAEPKRLDRFPDDGGEMAGKIMRAELDICGHSVIFNDSPSVHDFTFTPSTSLFVSCANEHDLDFKFEQLSLHGNVLMPVDNYGFSKRFAWVQDKFGVSWQLNVD